MVYRFLVDYVTLDGESIFVKESSGDVALLSSCDGRSQEVQIDGKNSIEYQYITGELKKRGTFIPHRTEWSAHKIDVKKGVESLCVIDRWQDVPSEKSYYSSLFTKSIFRRNNPKYSVVERDSVVVAIDYASLTPSQQLVMVGSSEQLGCWDVSRGVTMLDGDFPTLKSPSLRRSDALLSSQFKFVIVDSESGGVVWEEGENRTFNLPESITEESIYIALPAAKFNLCNWRGAGVAIPLFSIRTEQSMGVGEFLDLKKMVDWAVATGLRIIQILPINDTTIHRTNTDSYPYNTVSIYALHPQYIAPLAVGKISNREKLAEFVAEGKRLNALEVVDYMAVNNLKEGYMRELYSEIGTGMLSSKEFKEFFKINKYWLESYGVFSYLRDKYASADFNNWGAESKYSDSLITKYCSKRSKTYNDIAYYYFVQFNLHRQFIEARDYAAERGVAFKGDIPIGVCPTSVDVWQSPKLFNLNSQAGAPPDDFAVKGQNWGFPTYNWSVMAKDNYSWWSARFRKMAEYFDAYRIDHILGFFRIWEIPTDYIDGVMGHFSPALPYSVEELESRYGFAIDASHVEPDINDWLLSELFGDDKGGVVKNFLTLKKDGGYKFKRKFNTQRKLSQELESGELLEKLMSLFCEVLFVEDPYKKRHYHPRIAAQNSYKYRAMSGNDKELYDRLYNDFYYVRHNEFWRQEALAKLPVLISSTEMLACGEDLGMIPDCVAQVMDSEQILSLEVQRMPKDPFVEFANTSLYPYRAVATTSTHDMNPLRAWLLENREVSKRYLKAMFGIDADITDDCDGSICQMIIEQHTASPAIWTIFPLQDILSIDNAIRAVDPHAERINIPSNPRHYWRYRMHCSVEELLSYDDFNARLKTILKR